MPLLSKTRVYDAASIIFVPGLGDLELSGSKTITARVLEPFAASVAAIFTPYPSPKLYSQTFPSMSRQPIGPGHYHAFGIDLDKREVDPDVYFSREPLNPFPRFFIQLEVLKLYKGDPPVILSDIQRWISAKPGRASFYYDNGRNVFVDLADIDLQRFVHVFQLPEGLDRAKPRFQSLRRFYERCRIKAIDYDSFYAVVENVEAAAIGHFLHANPDRKIGWFGRRKWCDSALPSDYPHREGYKRAPEYVWVPFGLLFLLVLIFGGLTALSIFAGYATIGMFGGNSLAQIGLSAAICITGLVAQFWLLRAMFSELDSSDPNETRMGRAFVGLTTVTVLFLSVNAGYAAGLWEPRYSLGQFLGGLVALVFSPLLIAASLLQAINTPVSNWLVNNCALVPDVIGQISGGTWWDIAVNTTKAVWRIALSPLTEREVWQSLTGRGYPDSILEVSTKSFLAPSRYLIIVVLAIICAW